MKGIADNPFLSKWQPSGFKGLKANVAGALVMEKDLKNKIDNLCQTYKTIGTKWHTDFIVGFIMTGISLS
jgi:hypothetical protein